MIWELLCLTQSSRRAMLDQLRAQLYPQIDAANQVDARGRATRRAVGLNVHMHDPARSVGDNREWMRQHATGDYISFVDDDDLVAPDYIARILPLLVDGVDQIGFRLQCYFDGVPFGTTIHTLAAGGWHDDGRLYLRDISHLNPMRREIALTSPMEGGYGEDHRWADRLRVAGVVRTERFVGGATGPASDGRAFAPTLVTALAAPILYHYLARTVKDDARDATLPYRLALIESLQAMGQTDTRDPAPARR